MTLFNWFGRKNLKAARRPIKNIEVQVCHDEHRPITYIYVFWNRDSSFPAFTLRLNDEERHWLIDKLSYYDTEEYKKFHEWKNRD